MSHQAQELIQRIRTSAPSRNVGGGSKNVFGRYPSRKMGITIIHLGKTEIILRGDGDNLIQLSCSEQVYDTENHPSLGQSPQEAFSQTQRSVRSFD